MVALRFNSITDDSSVALELSRVPTSQIAVNGAQDPFLDISAFVNLLTSGLAIASHNMFYPLRVPCRQGEIIYLHAAVAGTVSYVFNGILWF
jgi:hypothetical protein